MGDFSLEDGMGNYRIDPKKQFSKRLARWTAWFWFCYMTWISIIMFLQPQVGIYVVYLGIIVTTVMLLNVWAYMKNSVFEKAVFGLLDKTKLELNLTNTNKTDSTETESDADESEVSNG